MLEGVRRTQGAAEIIDDVPMRMDEINSMIHVMREAAEFSPSDESFYQQHITKMLYSLGSKFDELQVLIDAILKEKWEREKKPVKVA